MRLNKEVIDQLLEEHNISPNEFHKLFHGARGELWVMENIKCGFNRAYQIAEIFNCTVDDIVIYSEDKWPRYHRPEDDGRTKAGRAKRKRQREREAKLKEKNNG